MLSGDERWRTCVVLPVAGLVGDAGCVLGEHAAYHRYTRDYSVHCCGHEDGHGDLCNTAAAAPAGSLLALTLATAVYLSG